MWSDIPKVKYVRNSFIYSLSLWGIKSQFFTPKQKLIDKFGDHIKDQVSHNYSALPRVVAMCKAAVNWFYFQGLYSPGMMLQADAQVKRAFSN